MAHWIRNAIGIICLVALVAIRLSPTSWISLVCGRPVLFMLGCWLIADSLLILRRRYLLKQHGITTTGQLKELKSHGRWIKPVVEFTTQDGATVVTEVQQSVTFDWYITKLTFSSERTLEITYNPYKPREVFIYASLSIWLGPIIGILFGLFLSIFIFMPWSSEYL